MAASRWFASVLFAAALACSGGMPVFAQDHEDQVEAPPPKAHAVVSGTVIGVDYGAANIVVGTPHGAVPIAVTPTTSIIHGATYASLADLGRGSRVIVHVVQFGRRLIAQIIHIR
ncbi:MAG TPA: hypothetical protein VFA29_14660 [Candidatus Baltobacteraceae bacterium]|nr:hypothetical protein [Candidatus Baltobacteraceae bacterium]